MERPPGWSLSPSSCRSLRDQFVVWFLSLGKYIGVSKGSCAFVEAKTTESMVSYDLKWASVSFYHPSSSLKRHAVEPGDQPPGLRGESSGNDLCAWRAI